jgi:replication-associated recombination protein RarA
MCQASNLLGMNEQRERVAQLVVEVVGASRSNHILEARNPLHVLPPINMCIT